MFLGRGLVQCFFWSFALFSFTTLGWSHQCPIFTIRGKYAMETGQVNRSKKENMAVLIAGGYSTEKIRLVTRLIWLLPDYLAFGDHTQISKGNNPAIIGEVGAGERRG